MTIRSLDTDRAARLRSWGSLVCAACSLAVVTCAGARQGPAVPDATLVDSSASPPPPAAASIPAPVAPEEGLDATAPGPDGPLARFYADLASLSLGDRTDPVRILWLGDSHTAADFWPDAVRRPLQERFGDGGPGFVYVGLRVYRHAGLTMEDEGKWTRRPRSPSYWERQDDGVFGLGGIRTTPQTAASRAEIALDADVAKRLGRVRYDIAYRANGEADTLVVSYGNETTELDSKLGEASESGIRHHVFETEAEHALTIRGGGGQPEVFGVIIEGTRPGVVLDALGINGARVGTPVAWDGDAWIAEARRRKPSLAVIAYGTNEVGDAVAPWRYGALYDELVRRLREAAPEVDCAIIGPTERASPDWTTHPRVAELEAVEREAADRLGCLYVSAFAAMGGSGSLKRWAEQTPAFASSDRVHLTPLGYRELGTAIGETLLEGYSGGAPRP